MWARQVRNRGRLRLPLRPQSRFRRPRTDERTEEHTKEYSKYSESREIVVLWGWWKDPRLFVCLPVCLVHVRCMAQPETPPRPVSQVNTWGQPGAAAPAGHALQASREPVKVPYMHAPPGSWCFWALAQTLWTLRPQSASLAAPKKRRVVSIIEPQTKSGALFGDVGAER